MGSNRHSDMVQLQDGERFLNLTRPPPQSQIAALILEGFPHLISVFLAMSTTNLPSGAGTLSPTPVGGEGLTVPTGLQGPANTQATPKTIAPPSPSNETTSGLSPISSQSVSSNSGANGGAIAGAAVGCLIAGLLLGFAIAFFFLRRRKQKEEDGHGAVDESKALFAGPSPLAGGKFQLDMFLLDSSPDKEIASELRSLGTLILQHVENNYHLHPVQEDPRVLAVSLIQLGIGNGDSLAPDALAQLALEPSTRQVALQHVISQVLFTSVDVSSRSQLSMLPAPLAAFLRSMPKRETGEKTESEYQPQLSVVLGMQTAANTRQPRSLIICPEPVARAVGIPAAPRSKRAHTAPDVKRSRGPAGSSACRCAGTIPGVFRGERRG